MTITIAGPDGSEFEFPPGTSQDIIASAMQKHYGAPKPDDRSFGGDKDLQQQYAFRSGRPQAQPSQEPTLYGAVDRGLTAIFKPINQAMKPAVDYAERATSSALLGAKDEIGAGMGALSDTLTGNRGMGDNYDRRLQLERALRDDNTKATAGVGGVAADFAGGLLMAPGKAVQAVVAAAPIGRETVREASRRMLAEKVAMAPQLAKTGAVWGGANALFATDGSIDPNATIVDHATKRFAAVPEGAAEGAVGALLFGNALHSGLGIRDVRRARHAETNSQNRLRAMEMEAEGITPFGPIITGNQTAAATARGLSDSIVGGSIRDAASTSIRQTEARAQSLVREHTGGATSDAMGTSAQGMLRHNLHDYDISNREMRTMPNAELERIAGPVTDHGFRPPRPNIDPIPPREVPDVTPDQFKAEGLPPRVPPVEPTVEHMDRRNIPAPPEVAFKLVDHQARVRNFNNQYQHGVQKDSVDLSTVPPTTRQELELKSIEGRFREIESKLDPNRIAPIETRERMQRLADRHAKLTEELRPMRDGHASLMQERKELAALAEQHRNAEFVRIARENHARSVVTAEAETLRRNASSETTARREQARMDAEQQTQAARDQAERTYQDELASSPHGFRAGRTQHTYPTEFAAGYERVSRETPTVQRNILGGRNETHPTATESLLHDFAATARRQNQAAGYRDGQLFGVDGSVMHPGVSSYLHRMLGPDIAGQIQAYAQRRATGGFNPGIDGIRDLRTTVRRAAQDAERGLAPGQTRTTDAAMLRRLEGALTEDMHAFQQQQGPQGQRSSTMMRGVDAEYRNVAENLRRPLSRLYGDNVTPVQAMDRLARAATDGDLRTLNAFMRVAREKASPSEAAMGIVSHMTEGANNLNAFLAGYGRVAPEARTALFRDAPAMRASLDRLESTMRRLEPYQRPIATGGGIDLTRRTNLALAATAVAHPVAAVFAAGGSAMMARFMASPRYVNWLTTVATQSQRGMGAPQAIKSVGRLLALAASDEDKSRGKAVLGVAADLVLPSTAKAAPLSPADRAKIRPLTEKVLFAGTSSKTADTTTLAEARAMDAAGSDKADTWKKTGWAKGGDGKWRYEIDDSAAKLHDTAAPLAAAAAAMDKGSDGTQSSLPAVLDHPELFKAYPSLKKLKVQMFSEQVYPIIKNYWAYYDKKNGAIVINANKAASQPDVLKAAILHEVQHDLQLDKDKLFYGVGDKGVLSNYDKRPGEVEAYDVERRQSLSKDQRRQAVPGIIANGPKLEWGPGILSATQEKR